MELVYLWVEDYKNIHKQGFNFSPRFRCEFKDEYEKYIDTDGKEKEKLKDNCELIIEKKEYKSIFPDNINITAIVGENGSGKSSILDLLLNRYLNKNKLFFIYYQNNKLYLSGVSNPTSIDVKNSVTLNISINDFLHIVDDTKIVYYSNILNEADHVLPSFVEGHYLAKSMNISTSYTLDQNKIIETEFKVINAHPKTGFDKIYRSYRIQQIQMALLAIKNNSKASFKPPFDIPDKIIIKNVNLKNLFIKFKEDFKKDFEKNPFRELLDILEKSNSSEEIFSNYVKMNLILSLILENKDSPNLKKLLRNILNAKTVSSLDYFYTNARKRLIDIDSKRKNNLQYNSYTEFFRNADKLLSEIEKFPKKISNGYEIELSIEDNEFDFLEIYERLIQQSEYFWDFNWRGLSSGEETFLYQFSRFYFLRENFKEDENLNLKIEKKEVKNLIWLIDEGEGNLHPEWQKKYIKYLIEFFNKNFTQNIHIILTSHSPFILSDLPKENIIFLEKGKQVYPFEDGKQTFGANIHTLLSHGFFMKDGLMGEFAKEKINDVINFLNGNKSLITTNDEAQNLINIIGEPVIKKQLQKMLDSKRLSKIDEIDLIKNQMKELSKRLEEIENAKD
ncbi:ATP-binding protein [Aliarcobacter butzleri]|uniref:ATP-binding protein n=1 Tax=Aliarcobacter butzleri TaxID=28197 RepID=UPI001EDD5D8F|nr:ATP-binding protein [Aliarcobacter butzleri]MCG3699626.1 ATP-binding protein [Aliarcobacter butzleri]MDN5079833.1 ATP-binding protein [Aliarcobacter butzleri]MDN5091082.1 ATP-binding protein [Aliarcobacter butzleri]